MSRLGGNRSALHQLFGTGGSIDSPHPMLRALRRPALSTIGLVVLYYVLPLDNGFEPKTVVALIAGLLAFVAITAGQVLQIANSPHPRLRALTALANSLPLFLVVFATTYFVAAQSNPHAFTETLSKTDALYFTVTVFATVGFGDIAPVTTDMRVVAMFQMLGDLVVIGLLGRMILGAVTEGVRRNTDLHDQVEERPQN
jgi:hypothetical protein